MNIFMYHQMCISVVELCTYIVLTRFSLVSKDVQDTQPRLICKLAGDSIPLVMGMVIMLIQLTLTWLKCLVGQIDTY
jgi:hypothetical protein